jgi:hypothetical protein
MSRPQRTAVAALAVAAIACAVIVIEVALPSPAHASSTQASMLLDDQQLIYSGDAHMVSTLQKLHSLGVDVVKVSLVWQLIAPEQRSDRRPGFNAGNPAAYPPGAWQRWDLLVETAHQLGMKVYFLLIGPSPRWAVPKANRHQGPALGWAPRFSEYRAFVRAAGRRYSGSFVDPTNHQPIPRVSYWGIWNEPNEISWLTPWYRRVSAHQIQLTQPLFYRGLVDAAWSGLRASGHARDTVLVGETANRGLMDPERFARALYCVDASLRPLRGSAAFSLGCPTSGSRAAFARAHPGLFRAYAHHPYGFQNPPNRPAPDPKFVTIQNLPSFERMLNRIFGQYGRRPGGGVPLYLTEWGYKTNPPNPYVPTSPAAQAAWINQGEYMTWREPYVRGLTQFLLVDSPPIPHTRKNSAAYWSSFQTGLEYIDGKPKPSFAAYQIPIWLPKSHHGSGVAVWGQLRPADHSSTQTGELQFEPAGSSNWQSLTSVSTNSSEGFLFTHVRIPSAGTLRLTWTALDGTLYSSRWVPIS